jgi:hypothetical protein
MELFHEPMDGNAEFIRQSRPLPDESGVPLAGWFTVPMRAFAIKEVSQKHLGSAGVSPASCSSSRARNNRWRGCFLQTLTSAAGDWRRKFCKTVTTAACGVRKLGT